MTKDEMLRRAEECRRLADVARQLENKQTLVDMAETWERLALRRHLAEIQIGLSNAAQDNSRHRASRHYYRY
jgi:hypothetical protein